MNSSGKHSLAARLRLALRHVPLVRGGRIVRDAYRILLLLTAAIVIDLAFPGGTTTDLPVLQEGSVASEDIIASIAFPVFKAETELTQEREEAAGAVAAIFDHRPEVADSAIARSREFFDAIGQAAAEGEDEAVKRQSVREVLGRFRIAASENQVALLVEDAPRGRLANSVKSAFEDELKPGVASSAELRAAPGGIILRTNGDEALVRSDSIETMQQFYELAAERAPREGGGGAVRLYQNLVIHFSEPTIQPNEDATEAARDQARQAVDPVKYRVLEGERIVGAHERVGPEHVERLVGYAEQLAEAEVRRPWQARLGNGLYNLFALIIFGLLLKYFRPGVYASYRSLALIWVMVVVVAGAAAFIARTGLPTELIPIAFAALVLATLFDGMLAILAVVAIVGLVAGRPPLLSMTVLYSTLIGGAAAALGGRVVSRRAHTWMLAAVIAGAYLLAAVSLALILRSSLGWVLTSVLWSSVNAVGATLLAMSILPLAESFTRITTNQTLLELSDVNRPLLRRLSLEAPGTYAHSINVANLAEAAARAIDANSLLVRVGIYYHDIGKIKKPQFFVENQPRSGNPHDKLKPAMSAAIVREHVVEGLQLATEAKLPEVVKAFITEHHGTQRIGFFYEKARELDPDAELDIDDFTYPGPKPQSRETAIALLADSVESAARTLQDPSPEHITALVDRIVAGKMNDGQLNRAPLTLRALNAIKEQFVKVLSGMYHHRLDYPSAEPDAAPKTQEAAVRGSS